MLPLERNKIIIIVVAIAILHGIFVLLPVILGGVGGNFGVRPRSHRCIGVVISNSKALGTFPKGDFKFNFLGKGYEYRINEDRMLSDVCIGQDVWYGE